MGGLLTVWRALIFYLFTAGIFLAVQFTEGEARKETKNRALTEITPFKTHFKIS